VNRQPGPGGGMQPLEETEFAVREINNNPSKIDIAAAIVGYANLLRGDAVSPVLEDHIAASGGRFRGIRFMVGEPPGLKYQPLSESLVGDNKYLTGIASLIKHGLSYDVMVSHDQLKDIARLGAMFPDLPVIINHIGYSDVKGKSDIERERIFEEWQNGIATIAEQKNIYLKLGGLGMEMFDFGWSSQPQPPTSLQLAETMSPYFLYCIEKLGADRCMFESNFPVDKVSYSYNILWNAFKRITTGFSAAERYDLFYGTAARVYRLPGSKLTA